MVVTAGCSTLDRIESGASPLNLGEYRLARWKRGVTIRPLFQSGREMTLWFYEWNLFDAFEPGELTQGYWKFDVRIRDEGRSALISSEDRGVNLAITTSARGADLVLTVTNKTDHTWGENAAIVPCLSPGPAHGAPKILRRPRTTAFLNTRTWYLSAAGLERMQGREVHFARDARLPANREYAFSDRWPPSDTPAERGLLVRESNDSTWIAGIEWEDFVTVQAHNPWDCMHVGIRVGPLAPGETKTIRGRIMLSPGAKKDALIRDVTAS
jgi:hypothetical protein